MTSVQWLSLGSVVIVLVGVALLIHLNTCKGRPKAVRS